MPRITQLDNEPKNNGENKTTSTNTRTVSAGRKTTVNTKPATDVNRRVTTQKSDTAKTQSRPEATKTETAKPKDNGGFLNKYFTKEGVESLPDDSKWKQLSQKLDSNFKDDGTIGSSFVTSDSKAMEMGKKASNALSAETLLSSGTSKGNTLSSRIESIFDGGYKMTDEQINQLGGVYLNKTTGEKMDDDYVNSLYGAYSQKAEDINGAVEKLNSDRQSGLITDEEYVNGYKELEKQWDENQKYGAELDNVDYKVGKDYYDWLKENGTQQEIEDFEAYVASYDDSILESLANAEKEYLVNLASRPIQAYEMLKAVNDENFDYTQGLSFQMKEVANELHSYTLNGKNDVGFRNYSLQTIESIIPMVNDAIIATAIGGAMGMGKAGIKMFASGFTNVEMAIGSADETLRTRLAEGNSLECSAMDATAHGMITGMVEGLNAGGIVNVVDFLTGGGGMGLLGAGLFALPNIISMVYNGVKDFAGEGTEEAIEAYLDKYIDERLSYVYGEPIQSEDVTWGKIGEGGMTDQFIMAGAGAWLMGVPQNVSVVVDSGKKYYASGQAVKYWNSFAEYYAQQGDTKNANVCNSIANLIENERKTYESMSQTTGVTFVDEIESEQAPTVEEALNAVANAFKLDVNDQMQNVEQMKQGATQSIADLNAELERRGYAGKLDIDTYLKADPEARTMSKNILDFANQIGADVRITDNFDYLKGDKVIHKQMKGNENGVTVYNDTIVINPFAKDFKTEGVAKAMIETLSHELTHTTELTDINGELSDSYKQLEQTVRNAMGDKAWSESFKEIKSRYGYRTKNETQVNREVVANYIGKNIGSQKFLQTLANYNSSAFTRIYSGMKALLSQNAKVANDFFKAYEARIENAMQHTYYTNVYGDLISAYDCQFNVSQYKERGRDVLKSFLDKQVKNGSLTAEDAEGIISQLDWYSDEIDKLANDPDHLFDNFANWSNVSMTKDHDGYPQLTCVVENGDYKMNIDFSTVCKKRKVADAVFNEIARMGVLDGRALTQEEIGKIREIVKANNLEVACSLCFVDSKRFNQGGWADTLINGKEDKIKKELVKLGVQDKNTKHIMGWNEMVDLLANDPSEIGEFNFAGRESVSEGTLHTLDDSQVNQKGLAKLKEIADNTSNKSEIGKIARALLEYPELRRHILLGDLYGSEAFGQIKRGVLENNEANEALFKIINAHQGVAKPKSPYLEVTYNNEIIKSKTFDSQKAREVGGVRIQSFSDYMANMVFDYMECVAELQAKGLTAHAYTKVKEFAELFGQTGIKINLSIIPKATTMSSREFLQLSDTEKEEVKRYAGLGKFTIEQASEFKTDPSNIDRNELETICKSLGLDVEETLEDGRTLYDQLEAKRGFGLSEDGSCYTAYIFEDESFDWLDALELQTREGYDKNVGTICVGVSDEHIWKMMADNNVKQIIPYHKSSLNHIVAQMMNIGAYNDYTDFQNTRVLKNGEWKSINSDDVKGTDFAFYTDGMLTNGYDAKATSNMYLQWCAENGYLPKFDQFAYIENPNGDWVRNENGSYSYVGEGNGNLSFNENYYKVLIDFRAYDANNNLAPQESVRLSLPNNFMDMVRDSLSNYEDVMNNQKAVLPKVVNEVVDMLDGNNEMQFNISANDMMPNRDVLDTNYSEKEIDKTHRNGDYIEGLDYDIETFFKEHANGPSRKLLWLGKIKPDLVARVKDDTGFNLNGKSLVLSSDNDIHLDKHLTGDDAVNGSPIPISYSDLEHIADIINNYDRVEHYVDHPKGGDQDRLRFETDVDGKDYYYRVIELVPTRNKTSVLVTMYTVKKGDPQVPDASLDAPDSLTSANNGNGLSYAPSNNNISSSDGDVNNDLEYNVSEADDAQQMEDNILSISDDQVPIKSVKLDSKTLDKNKVAQVLRDMPEVKDEEGKWKRLQQIMEHEFLDHLDRIVELSKEYKNPQIEADADFAMMAQARANEAIFDKRREFVIDKKKSKAVEKGESLKDIIGDLDRDQIQTLGDYLYNWRNVDSMTVVERLGKEYNGIKMKNKTVFGKDVSADESRERIAEIENENPWVKKKAERLWEFSRQNLKMLLDAGIVSKDTYDYYQKATPHYIPIQRNVEGSSGVQSLDPNKADLKFKGSSEDILPLDHNLITHTQKVYNTVAQNKLHNDIMDTVGNLEEMTPDEVEDVFETNFNPLSVDEKTGKRMYAYKNGKKFSMPVDDRLYDSLAPLQKRGKEFKTLQNINNFRRNLITGWNPLFAITNMMKDLQDAVFNTKHPLQFRLNYPEAWAQILGKGEFYKLYRSAGGGMNSYVNEFGVADIKGDNALKKAWKGLLAVNEAIETAPRLAEFMVSLKNGSSLEQAMLDASEVTTNFKRGGDTAKYLNRNGMAFFNASLQGYRRQLRNIQDAKDGGVKGMLTFMAKAVLTSGFQLALLNHMMWKDDDDYDELSDYVKNNYYIVAKYGDGKFIRIPKGRISAFYQTVMKNTKLTLEGKVKLWDAMMDDLTSFMDNIAPNNPWENFIAKPLIDAKNNKTWYGGDLVPSRLQDVPDSEQYDESTDELSKAIGRLSKKVADATGADFLELSPKKINYVLDQYSGAIGDIVLPALTPAITQESKVPFVNAVLDKFTTDPILKNQNVTDLYSLRDEVTKKANSLNATDEEKLSSKYLYSISSEMGELYGKKREIQADTSLSTKEKFDKVREIQKQINELAKVGLANYDQIDITGNYATVGDVQYYKTADGQWRKPSKSQLKNVQGISDEDKDGYFQTFGEISDIRDEIKANTPEGQKANYTDATIEAIRNSNMSASGKNALLDSYYNSKTSQHINDMGWSDEKKFDVKVAVQKAEGQKDENGKTISNSKAEAVAEIYRQQGVLDDVLQYIKDNNIEPSEMGLSKTVFKNLTGSSSKKKSGSSSKKKTSSKSSKTSSGGKSIKASGGSSTKKVNLVSNPMKETKPNLKRYFNAYQSVFGNGSKKVSTGGSQTVTCPNCGNSVSSSTGRCPICGANL